MTLWAFGVEFYNPFGKVTHARFHLFDAVIILTTFVLEAVLKGRERELAGLLIVLRLWRLIKLVGGKVALFSSDLDVHRFYKALPLVLVSSRKRNSQRRGKSLKMPEQTFPLFALKIRRSRQDWLHSKFSYEPFVLSTVVSTIIPVILYVLQLVQ